MPSVPPKKVGPAKSFFKALIRTKPMEVDNWTMDMLQGSQLKRCLTTFDLTALGVGSTLGMGIYNLPGLVASRIAGPAVCLSVLIAAIASVFAGLCYAEFGARVPRAGSAYVYSYVTVGEFMAFIIGWNLILDYVISTAALARGYSEFIDSLFDRTIETHLRASMPINIPYMSPYPDFLAFGITLFLTIMLAVGVKESTRFNNIFTGLNLVVVVFAIIAGAIKSDIKNWNLDFSNVTDSADDELFHPHKGSGGFFPFGVSGMMSGAATCFYGFIGFACIATTGEEVKNPQKSIPISIVLSLLFVFLAYFGMSSTQTLKAPYYLLEPFYLFNSVDWNWSRWIIIVGALAALSTSLLGALFPLPRVLYAMASDGVIFKFLADVSPKFKTPLIATAFSGLFAGSMAMMFDVIELVDLMSIGTLLAYILVAICVLILRYKPDQQDNSIKTSPAYSTMNNGNDETDSREKAANLMNGSLPIGLEKLAYSDVFRILLNLDRHKTPTALTAKISTFLISVLSVLVVCLDGILAWCEDQIQRLDVTTLCCILVLVLLFIVTTLVLCRQPVEDKKLSFKVPLVPFIPMLSVFVNVYLMFKLSLLTWKRFGVWMVIGFCVYFFYGLWHSIERVPQPPTRVTQLVDKDRDNATRIGPNNGQPSVASQQMSELNSKFGDSATLVHDTKTSGV